jgi:PIN domain nuclease of toxin-antitoxin system
VKLLLDTPVWVWSLLEPERLAPAHRAALESHDAELWLSPVSVWELFALIAEGRVAVNGDPAQWVADALRAVPMREAALTHEVAARSHALDLSGADPAGRLIAATAHVHGLTLVTEDGRLTATKEVRSLGTN